MSIKDRYNAVYIMVIIIGIGTILPFNILMNAGQYFLNEKLSSDSPSPVETNIRDNFISYLGMACSLPNVFLQAVNLFAKFGEGNIRLRILYSIIIELFIFGLIILLTFIQIKPIIFFINIMVFSTLMNGAGGIFQNSGFGLTANLPPSYTNAVITGSNMGGVLASFANVIAIYVAGGTKFSPLTFFIIAQLFLISSLIACILIYKNEFFNSFQLLNRQDIETSESSTSSSNRNRANYQLIFSEIWQECLSAFLTFFVSLILFPAVQGSVISTSGLVAPLYFAPLFTFCNFNLFAMLGNMITFSDQCPRISRRFAMLASILRFCFIPFFLYFCNYQPLSGRHLKVLYANDFIFILGGSFLGFSSGYLSSIIMMNAPKKVKNPENAELAAMMAGFFIIIGIFSGLTCSYLMPLLV